jgi:Kdo2-lipid IVA lauroyltransferase/acyltransferase
MEGPINDPCRAAPWRTPRDRGSRTPTDGAGAPGGRPILSRFRAGWRRLAYGARRAAQALAHGIITPPTLGAIALLRALGPDRASNFGGSIARRLGPLLPVQRIGLENLRDAFPDMDEAERRAILREVWDNLGRTAAEYPHLAALWDYDENNARPGRIEVAGIETFKRLRDDGKPAIIFTAHLANWELPAVCAARHGLEVTAVYRTPNNPYVARRIEQIRSGAMGGLLAAGSGQAVAFAMASVIERGGHLGLLVDQRLRRGMKVPFFGRPAPTNPILGQLARRFECPVHGVRVIRLPDNCFRVELTDEIALPRDGDGLIDVAASMRRVNEIVEGWVREHPGQWLWLHRRWRM